MKTYSVIKFNDLSYETQEDIKRDCRERLAEKLTKDDLMDIVGTDRDGKLIPEDVFIYLHDKVEEAVGKSWVEWEIEL